LVHSHLVIKVNRVVTHENIVIPDSIYQFILLEALSLSIFGSILEGAAEVGLILKSVKLSKSIELSFRYLPIKEGSLRNRSTKDWNPIGRTESFESLIFCVGVELAVSVLRSCGEEFLIHDGIFVGLVVIGWQF